MLPSRFSPQSVSGMEFKDPHGPWSRGRCSHQHGLKLGVTGATDGRFGASARDYYSSATMTWVRLRKLQHVTLVARIPPLRPVVVCGRLLLGPVFSYDRWIVDRFQVSWRSEVQFYQMKQRIRGLRIVGTPTYSQTLNWYDTDALSMALGNPGKTMIFASGRTHNRSRSPRWAASGW